MTFLQTLLLFWLLQEISVVIPDDDDDDAMDANEDAKGDAPEAPEAPEAPMDEDVDD